MVAMIHVIVHMDMLGTKLICAVVRTVVHNVTVLQAIQWLVIVATMRIPYDLVELHLPRVISKILDTMAAQHAETVITFAVADVASVEVATTAVTMAVEEQELVAEELEVRAAKIATGEYATAPMDLVLVPPVVDTLVVLPTVTPAMVKDAPSML